MSASYDLNEAMELAVRKARPEDDEVQVWAGRLMQKFTAEKSFYYRGFLSIRLDEVMAASLSNSFALGEVERSLELVKVQEAGQFLAVVEYALDKSAFL